MARVLSLASSTLILYANRRSGLAQSPSTSMYTVRLRMGIEIYILLFAIIDKKYAAAIFNLHILPEYDEELEGTSTSFAGSV
ncbi:hypothetical protein EDD17DRAFT_707241 [Pisolithus thermaeus]|nr:hypothetical protein EV401DRAFT_151522 [Pisolithus croceorrhizus]KAI6161229.1 hypothetical protein EDD17DRAFT_707241 [Pisolithus thermaeus]